MTAAQLKDAVKAVGRPW
ncbi:hypothetical protein AB8E26_16450 [Stenotrophomonas rhizophila]